ncbi:MAG: hypothetical protein JWM02_2632 [Frankiales bacterium]|nr:hypothetical protein [Frankiales bacterium]
MSWGGIAAASTEVVAAPLAAPTGLTPDDSTTALPHQVRKSVTLDWSAVSGATGYRVQVGTDDTWSDDPTFTKDVVSSQFTLPVWLPHASYVWRVAALRGTAVGHWSSESGNLHSDAQFTKGWRDAPQPVSVQPFKARPTYSWSPVASATGYQLQVSTDPFFASGPSSSSPDTTPGPQTQTQAKTVHDTCFTARTRVAPAMSRAGAGGSVGDCVFTVPDLGSTIYWRVRALDRFVGSAQTVDTTPVSKAGISYQPPATDTDQTDVTSDCPGTVAASASPSASATATASPSASASASPGSGSGASQGACEPTDASEASSWSAVSSFAYSPTGIAAAPLGLVSTDSLAGEADGLCTVTNPAGPDAEKATCRDVPTISWRSAPDAVRYRIYIGLDDAFTNIQTIVETSAQEWTPTGSWRDSSPGESYYYVVQACDMTQCGPVTATPRSFRKVTPRPVLGAKPAKTADFTLSWQSYADSLAAATGQAAPEDAYAYHVQVATSDHPAYDVLVDDATVDETSYSSPNKLYGDGSFVWRVQPIDSAGHKLPYSFSQAFTRDATPPKLVSVAPHAGVAVTQALKLTFSEPVTGLSSSTVTLSPAAPTTLSVTSGSTATLVPTKPLVPGQSYTVQVSPAVKDTSGNSAVAVGPAVTVNPVVDDSSVALGYSTGWKVYASSNAWGGRFHASTPTPTSHPSTTLVFRGTGLSLKACLGPANGFVDLYVDGVRRARVSTYRSFSGCGVKVAALTGLSRTRHTVKVIGVGSRVAASRGNAIGLDVLTVTP